MGWGTLGYVLGLLPQPKTLTQQLLKKDELPSSSAQPPHTRALRYTACLLAGRVTREGGPPRTWTTVIGRASSLASGGPMKFAQAIDEGLYVLVPSRKAPCGRQLVCGSWSTQGSLCPGIQKQNTSQRNITKIIYQNNQKRKLLPILPSLDSR